MGVNTSERKKRKTKQKKKDTNIFSGRPGTNDHHNPRSFYNTYGTHDRSFITKTKPNEADEDNWQQLRGRSCYDAALKFSLGSKKRKLAGIA